MSIDDLRTKFDRYPQKYAEHESELAGCSFNFSDQKIPRILFRLHTVSKNTKNP